LVPVAVEVGVVVAVAVAVAVAVINLDGHHDLAARCGASAHRKLGGVGLCRLEVGKQGLPGRVMKSASEAIRWGCCTDTLPSCWLRRASGGAGEGVRVCVCVCARVWPGVICVVVFGNSPVRLEGGRKKGRGREMAVAKGQILCVASWEPLMKASRATAMLRCCVVPAWAGVIDVAAPERKRPRW